MSSPPRQRRTPLRQSNAQSVNSRLMASRLANTQPSYDFLAGAPTEGTPQNKRQSFRQSTAVKADIGNEELRTQLKALQYEVESFKQKRELTNLRHEKELRDAQARADNDFKKAQSSERSEHVSTRRFEALATELKEAQDNATNKQNDLEKKLRAAQEERRSLKEDLDESQSDLSTIDRQYKHQINEIESKHATLQKTIADLRNDLTTETNARRAAQESLSKRDADIGQLENEVLRLKAQTGDAETVAVIKKDLSDQVAHIRKLETLNREQNAELKRFRMNYRAVEVVQEEKKELETKITLMEDLRSELREAQLQRQILEDEKSAWTAYLEDQPSIDGADLKTPENLARALVRQRLETVNMVEKIGQLKSEILDRDQALTALESQHQGTLKEIEKLKSSPMPTAGVDSNTKKRLERQRALAIKEVNFLREQLRTFDTEETTFQPENKFNEEKSQRIQKLESIIDEYRSELSSLNETVSKLEDKISSSAPSVQQPTTPLPISRKRPLENDDTTADQLATESTPFGALSRKNRTLQDSLSGLQQENAVLRSDYAATTKQLRTLQQSSKTRILALKNNPTSNYEKVKVETLKSLEEENKDLLAKLEGIAPPPGQPTTISSAGGAASNNNTNDPNPSIIPPATLSRYRREISSLKHDLAEKSKRELRLKQIWSLKSLEFREAVASLLGWKMNFLPNGRFSMTSIFNEALNSNNPPDDPSSAQQEGGGGAVSGSRDVEEKAIIFDGETGTMKVSGGPDGPFGREIKSQIEYWVKGRGEIPCFMAGLTMEFWERSTRAARG